MFLKRLELQGFKSFADKTVLDFSGGVTAVVGPNGSGKSNISDAIRWVMGEMSAKSLRGSNMQDVIFAGTQKRKPLNYAEVSLVLDNSDRIFNVDYNEVIVTRRVFRSGESLYQINRVNCRLKDIHELFMDTGLGRDGYSMIGQGNVSQILSTKAEDRRNLFEEAAGVSKYKYKKEESIRKLNHVDENLVRIGDITNELENQLGPLKSQSEKARKYLLLYDEFKQLDINLSMLIFKRNEETTKEVDKNADLVTGEIEEIRQSEAETEAKISACYEKSGKLDEEQNEKNQWLVDNQSAIMECKNQASLWENTITNNIAMTERLKGEINIHTQKSQQNKDQAEALLSEIHAKQEELVSLGQQLSEAQMGEKGISEKISNVESQILACHQNSAEALSQKSSFKAKMDGIETLRASYLARREAICQERETIQRNLQNTKEEIERLTEERDNLKEKSLKIADLISKQNAALSDRQAAFDTMTEEQNNGQVELRAMCSKRRILEDMENDYEGYSKSVKTILRSDEMKKYSLYGTVAGLVETDKKYAVAIETALGGASQNIITETEADAKAAIEFLRRSNSGRATFLPISSVKGRTIDNVNEVKSCNGFIGVASELVRYNSKYDGIMKSLLGRIVIVDNIDNAISMAKRFSYKFKIVTLLGDSLNSGGSMSGGSTGKTGGFLSRSAEIKTLKSSIAELERAIKIRQDKLEEEGVQLKSIKDRLESYLQMKHEYENDLIKAEEALKHLGDAVSGSSDAEGGFDAELKELEQKISASGEEFASCLSQMRQAENKEQELISKSKELEEEKERLIHLRDDAANGNVELTLSLSNVRRDIDELNRTRESLLEQSQISLTEAENKNRDIENILKANDELKLSVQQKLSEADQKEAEGEKVKVRIDELSKEKEQVVNELKEIQSSNKELTDRLIALQQELSRINSKQEKLEQERENIINRLWEDYELTISDAEERFEAPENEKEDTQRLTTLKGQIKALGNVNMDSIEEYKSVSERYEFLSGQMRDLEESKKNLEKIIESMEDLIKEHFIDQFTAINESFGYVFTELFGGGKARLYLQDPDNVLESGIEIEVQLPGKGLQNINLYSGGEKSFIAISLLFAILRVKPTPFCILDEIDAALDDVNVARFATYLKNYLDQSQFIVITHRRGTMEAANIMYGVTMQEKGVSKLLSLHMDDIDETMAN